MEFSVNQIAALLGGNVTGNGDIKIKSLGKIQDANQHDLAFLSNLKYESYIYTTNAGAVIVSNDFVPKEPVKATLIAVADPYSGFTALLEEYHKFVSFSKVGIENPSHADETATFGENLYRGAFSYVGKNSKIGNNVKIYPNAYIGDNVTIGNNTIIYAGVKIYSECKIGNNCKIHSGAVIGSDGFGFAPQADGSYKTIPQVGNVIIEDNVDIGANTVIDRATMGSTLIKKGVKLDNLIQIAHNVEIGSNTVIASQAGVAGSAIIGENCMIGGQVGIVGHLKIANKSKFAAKAGVMTDITEEGQTFMGGPAFPLRAFMKSWAIVKNLPELVSRIDVLEKKL
jgi:UDP-3-O-[3-hydroxymyristoyl] glucosamine N-acyltransferase